MKKNDGKNKMPLEAPAERYHHGDLRAALIQAADEIIIEKGLEGFSLRAAARRAGVSVSAPAHHFNSASGLLSEVAMLGFIELANYLEPGTGEPAVRLCRLGVGYVRFAIAFPGRFQLMFRRDLLDHEHPGLKAAGDKALEQLADIIREKGKLAEEQPLDTTARDLLVAVWSFVHGFAHLWLVGKLAYMYPGLPSEELLEKVLPQMLLGLWPD